ncbi:metal ABC transporter solute-binding protein, Zn/Mn family [uncultured Pseudodesulfovibrio sp.]|uniref:metal ABC transporter solute-binding protein, Zn/Mn family n=1 Tax=uncultured Pseudodesulfovibrio sp. TaxID=2035858 RepID=UPI0029C748C9|nr:zinc ABC transporter substrate-binding protein [uncultured Pseudodesulfovibrio sp.]
MNKMKFFAAIVLMVLFAIPAQAMSVTVSIAPLKYFSEYIGGDRVQVEVMVAPGASPATYEPKPRQMVSLTKSKLYIAIGVPFERAWLPRMKSANPDMIVVDSTAGMHMLPMISHHHESEGEEPHAVEHSHGIMDPHVWNSPRMARELAANILSALIQADAEGSPVYQKNYGRLMAKIDAVDTEIKGILKGAQGKHFLTYHPSWGYFARDYGLVQVPVELEGKEPGPKDLAEVIALAKEESITAIIVQPQFSDKSAQTIADAIGGQVVVADPLAENWADNLVAIARQFSTTFR